MVNYDVTVSGTASSGTFSFNTKKFDNAKLAQIIVKAATATTTFDVKIEDDNDIVVYQTETKPTGTLRHEVHIPLKGIHTVTIENASADEAFTGKLMVEEP